MASSEFSPLGPIGNHEPDPIALLAQIDVRSSHLAHLHTTERLLTASIAEDQERVHALTLNNGELPILHRIAWAAALEGNYSASERHDKMTTYKGFLAMLDAELQVADTPIMTIRKNMHSTEFYRTMRQKMMSEPVALLDADGTGLTAGSNQTHPLITKIGAIPRNKLQLGSLANIAPRRLVAVHTEESSLSPELVSLALGDHHIVRVVGSGAIEAFIAASAQIGNAAQGPAWRLAEVVGKTKL
jgi:hypothetical protein